MSQTPVTFTTIQGIQTAEVVHGEGKPIVMLHGWGANSGLITPLAEKLALMGYKCYVPDLPGFGQTAAPTISWSVHDYVKWVIAYLDAHQLDNVYLFGHSHGGRLGLILGAEHSDRILKMTLADAAGVKPKPSTNGQLRLRAYRFALNTLQRVGMKPQAEQLRTWYSERYGSADYKAAKGVMRETLVKVVNEDLLPYAARVKRSTILFWGDKDEDTPLWQGQLLEQTIPDAGLVVWEGAGHYSYLERAADTARVMDHFFK
ncbi:MAG: alpha/beta hydrolase [Chloroflexi bacterium]|nr:alpha/beta hydrolase [Chloroflexota bacterium]MCC6895660.1 alpha/beta hydrolase [Anaerolineae bacterium]